MADNNVVAIGIDGACWELIDQWVESGQLPNIAALKNDSVWGGLESCIPPVTCPAWKCYSTGKNPGKLGVYWCENLDITNRESNIPTSRSFDSPELWDYLNNHGLRTGIVGMPLTYPPKAVDGFMIAGGPGAPKTSFAHPDHIEEDLKSEFGYTPTVGNRGNPDDARNELVEGKIEKINLDFEVAKYLNSEYDIDFLQVCTFEINGPLQHLFFDDEPVRRAWQDIDKHIGDLAKIFDYVIIHSDHGTSEMDRQFFINSWLDEKGYLTRNVSITERLAEFGIHTGSIRKAVDTLRIRSLLKRSSLLRGVARRIPNEKGLFGETEGAAIFEKVDWDSTDAVGLAQGPIYINDESFTEDEYLETRQTLQSELNSYKDQTSESNPVQDVFKREEIYHGEYIDKAPDLVALDAPRYHNKGGIGKDSLFEESFWKGNNAREGLYVFAGPSVNSDRRDAEIYDLTPTILQLFDVPVPEDIDGSPIF